MRYAAVLACLNAHLQAYPGFDDADCAWPNRPFTPGDNGWWKVDFLPSTVSAALTANGDLHEHGIYQITRFEPTSLGALEALGRTDAMAAHFDRRIVAGDGFQVSCGVPELGPLLTEPGWFAAPLSIRFQVL